MRKYKLNIKIYLLFLLYFLFVDYKYFSYFAFFVITVSYYFRDQISFSKVEKYILKGLPFVFYFQKLVIGLFFENSMWERTFFDLKYSFADTKIVVDQLICQNNQKFLFADKFQSMTEECFFGGWRYGPLFHILKINISYEISVIFITVFLYLFFLFFLYELNKKKHITDLQFNIISLSSTVNLLLSQLNIDLLIFLIIFISITFLRKYFKLNLFIFFILALLKQHPIGLFFGLLFTEKKRSNFLNTIFYILSFVIINIYILYIDSNFLSGQPRPSGGHNSSGLLSISQFLWIQLFNSQFGFRFVLFLLVLIIIFLTLLTYKNRTIKFNELLLISKTETRYFSAILTWFLFTSLYANYDYRNIILVLLLFLYNFEFKVQYVFISVLLLSPNPVFDLEIFTYGIFLIKYFFYVYAVFICLSLIVSTESKYFRVINNIFNKQYNN